jgi:hypothetical protein
MVSTQRDGRCENFRQDDGRASVRRVAECAAKDARLARPASLRIYGRDNRRARRRR